MAYFNITRDARTQSYTPPGARNDMGNWRDPAQPEAYRAKFRTPQNPVVAEAMAPEMLPAPAVMSAGIAREFQRLREDKRNAGANQQALANEQFRGEHERIQRAVQDKFIQDFRQWCATPQVAPGGQAEMPTRSRHPSVVGYLGLSIERKAQFQKAIARLRLEGEQYGMSNWPVDKLWLYFKFVERGMEPSEAEAAMAIDTMGADAAVPAEGARIPPTTPPTAELSGGMATTVASPARTPSVHVPSPTLNPANVSPRSPGYYSTPQARGVPPPPLPTSPPVAPASLAPPAAPARPRTKMMPAYVPAAAPAASPQFDIDKLESPAAPAPDVQEVDVAAAATPDLEALRDAADRGEVDASPNTRAALDAEIERRHPAPPPPDPSTPRRSERGADAAAALPLPASPDADAPTGFTPGPAQLENTQRGVRNFLAKSGLSADDIRAQKAETDEADLYHAVTTGNVESLNATAAAYVQKVREKVTAEGKDEATLRRARHHTLKKLWAKDIRKKRGA